MDYSNFTLGIEEEYMVVDPVTRELKSHEQKIVEAASKILPEDQVKAEMHQAVVEVGTGICKNTKEARTDLTNLRRTISDVAKSFNEKYQIFNYFVPTLLLSLFFIPFGFSDISFDSSDGIYDVVVFLGLTLISNLLNYWRDKRAIRASR